MQLLVSMTLSVVLLICLGCGPSVEERSYQLKPKPSANEQLIGLLESYRDGQPLGSEVTSMTGMISDLKYTSPAKAEIAQRVFDQLMDSSNATNAAAISAEALEKLETIDVTE